jgi:hypothetical protein
MGARIKYIKARARERENERATPPQVKDVQKMFLLRLKEGGTVQQTTLRVCVYNSKEWKNRERAFLHYTSLCEYTFQRRRCSARVLQKEIFNYLKTCSKSLMSWRARVCTALLVHAPP